MSVTEPLPDRPRVYLAGPEVFLADAAAIGAEKCRLADATGFEGVFPLDAALDLSGLAVREQARRIALANEALMRSCDLMIANLTPFRGVSMDAGTAFEIGFMRALGRPVLGYSNVCDDFAARTRVYRSGQRHTFDADRAEVAIEDFGMVENLMIAVAIIDSGEDPVLPAVPSAIATIGDLTGFRRCLELARRHLD